MTESLGTTLTGPSQWWKIYHLRGCMGRPGQQVVAARLFVYLLLSSLSSRTVLGTIARLSTCPGLMPRQKHRRPTNQRAPAQRHGVRHGAEDQPVQRQREDDLRVDHVDGHEGLLRLQGESDEELLRESAVVKLKGVSI